jgi:hypothetical protein
VYAFVLVFLSSGRYVPCSRFYHILKNTPGACGFLRPHGEHQFSRADILQQLVLLNIPLYDVPAK